jgi:hypothetical protein
MTAAQARDTVWIPAVPLPFLGWRTDRCMCGQKFRGKNRRAAYELHYRRAHQRGDTSDTQAFMEVERSEAQRIYAEVNADVPVVDSDNIDGYDEGLPE